jgi:hypothetical protein
VTARRLPASDLPYWPRLLSHDLAAAYVGASPSLFDEEITKGVWPPGDLRGSRGGLRTWDRFALDAAQDRRAGLQPPAQQPGPRSIGDRFRNASTQKRRPQAGP